METSRPEKVLMKAAKAPAQVMPLRMEPSTPYLARDQGGEFQHDFVRPLGTGGGVKFRQEIAAQHAEDRREDIKDADQNHDPHGRLLGRHAVGIGVKPDQNMRQPGGAADEGDDQGEGVEQGVGFRFLGGQPGGFGGFGGQGAERGDPGFVRRGFFRQGDPRVRPRHSTDCTMAAAGGAASAAVLFSARFCPYPP